MNIIEYTCPICGKERTLIILKDSSPCKIGLCCDCCEKQGLKPLKCKMAKLELQRFAKGKKLNSNDIKGYLMEKAVSDALYSLRISHDHNPFNNTYPCYQNKRPDIVIKKLNMVIECKNLSKKQVVHSLSENWLDRNVIKRPYFKKYRRKIVVFSFKPLRPSITYLHNHGWKVYSIGTQILTLKQQKKAVGKMKQRLCWLQKEYFKNKPLRKKGQVKLKVRNFKKIVLQNPK